MASHNTVSNGNRRDQSTDGSIGPRNHFIKNERSHTRYFRQDIGVMIKTRHFLGIKYSRARLIDITPHGASIRAKKVMRKNNKVLMKVAFEEGETFVFRARIVRRHERLGMPPIYGVEFENRDARFKDKLIRTQLKSNLTKKFLKDAGESV